MSVINKMLRDLDKRQGRTPGALDIGATSSAAGVSVTQPLAGVPAWTTAPAKARRGSTLWIAFGVVLVSVAAAEWWMQQRGDWTGLSFSGTAQTTHTAPSPPAAAPAPLAAASQPDTAGAPPPATIAIAPPEPTPTPTPAAMPKPVASTVAIEAPTAAVTPVPQSNVPVPVAGLKMDTTLAMRKTVDGPTVKGPKPVAPLTLSLPEPRPPTSQEALLRAQSMWSAGSRDAAMDWLQEAIAVAERSPVAVNTPAGNPLLLPLVREQARMMLVEGRYTALWELLSRLEPQLGTSPDLWAIRANAAQRLGRHQDSVHSYMMALQARPDEQRWMLGAAVSLAALGQITSAAEMAERARALGVVSKDVLAYLRQMGVPLK